MCFIYYRLLFSAFSFHLSVFSLISFQLSFLLFVFRARARALSHKIGYFCVSCVFSFISRFFHPFPSLSHLSLVPLHSHSPRPSPFPPSLLQYGGWPLFIYAWDVIPRSFLLSISPVPLHSPSHSHSPLSIPPVPPSVWWLASVYICVGCYPAPIPHPIPPRPSPSHSHPCIPPIPPPVLSIPSFFFYAGYYPPSLPCGEGRGEAIYLSGLYVASSFAKIA